MVSDVKRLNSPFDFYWLVFGVVPFLAVWWTVRLYTVPVIPFPRQPAEFRPEDQLKKTQEDLTAVLEKSPENISAWIDLTMAHFEQGPDHYLSALEALERARDLGALDDRLFYYAATMYEATGLADYATPEYERFLRHRPEDAEARLRLGNLYYRTEELEKAIEQFRRVLAMRPEDPLVIYNLAMAHRDRGQW
ncbi:MAG: tetratricopeptide repeat protein, partial [Elusimicrobia bacterium]|nr:tetratricopeptide repeat protein [Elusimicrobiota bacterium]